MSVRGRLAAVFVFSCLAGAAHADELLYRWEGDVLPDDPSAGWVIFNPCDEDCTPSIADGHFVLRWVGGSDIVNYHLWIAQSPDVPPAPPFWVEWSFRSNTHLTNSPSCDGSFKWHYLQIDDSVDTHGDAAISFEGGDVITGLDPSMFHTYRFETDDGNDFRVFVDGELLFGYPDNETLTGAYLQMRGQGGCGTDEVNEWDFVRYGTIGGGERIVATDPPRGFLDPKQHAGLDRFTVTFDDPNYVYIDDIAVTVSDGVAPIVIQTRRLDNGDPETIQIVLDRPLPLDSVIRFDFLENDQVTDSVIYGQAPPIPAISAWGLVATLLAILTLGTLVLRRDAAYH